MNRPGTFQLYVARRLAAGCLLVLLVLTGFAFLVDSVELLRRQAGGAGSGAFDALEAALFRAPAQALRLTPLALVIAAALVANRFQRNAELAVARAAGLPLGRVLGTFALTGFALGLAALLLQAAAAGGLTLAATGSAGGAPPGKVWLTESQGEGRLILHGDVAASAPLRLADVMALRLDGAGNLIERIDASSAELMNGAWGFSEAEIWQRAGGSVRVGRREEPTALTSDAVLRPVSPPDALPFWSLATAIERLEYAGQPTIRHSLALHGWLALPALMAALAAAAGGGALRLPARTGAALAITFGVGLGFLLFIVADLASAFGAAGAIPPALAAWIPASVASFVALSCLVFVEDG